MILEGLLGSKGQAGLPRGLPAQVPVSAAAQAQAQAQAPVPGAAYGWRELNVER